ncbi:hypothetical protein [Acetobacter orientalis]|uniref:hypothetical protein n=1 Tax=Acetobacter orientalis TaxID=146474 RepID=UPI0039EAD004
MTDTAKKNPPTDTETVVDQTKSKVCGIVMPIAPMSEDYSTAHWLRVRKILEKAITNAGFSPNVVWDNPDVAVIQSKILKNIYENEVIICDLSNLNSNVMLEAGLRLSTKKPTILVTDGEKKPPFDVAAIEYIPYPKNLEYNEINSFIENLSDRISVVSKAYTAGNYKSFADSYQFEVATPSTIKVPAENILIKEISDLKSLIMTNMKIKNCNTEIFQQPNIDNQKNRRLEFILGMEFVQLIDLIKDNNMEKLINSVNIRTTSNGSRRFSLLLNNDTSELEYNFLKHFLLEAGAYFYS